MENLDSGPCGFEKLLCSDVGLAGRKGATPGSQATLIRAVNLVAA